MVHSNTHFDAKIKKLPEVQLHQPNKRRTTLTLPADSQNQAERIAKSRHVNLSTVISEALTEGLRQHAAKERADAVMTAYGRAFAGLSEDELAILDGVILEPVID